MNMWRFGTFIRIEVKPKMSNSNYRWHSIKFVIIESCWFFILILTAWIVDLVVRGRRVSAIADLITQFLRGVKSPFFQQALINVCPLAFPTHLEFLKSVVYHQEK
jgi:hypothetical protein